MEIRPGHRTGEGRMISMAADWDFTGGKQGSHLDLSAAADLVSAHRLVTWDRSQSVVGRHHRRRCDILCVTVTHCDVASVIQFHRVFKIGIFKSLTPLMATMMITVCIHTTKIE